MKGGPLTADFLVYSDFYHYKCGIYENVCGEFVGYHAVKLVGWGFDEFTGTYYWIAANSWGTKWGENGFFRIKEGILGIDDIAYGCKPKCAQFELPKIEHHEDHRNFF